LQHRLANCHNDEQRSTRNSALTLVVLRIFFASPTADV
jgi:hypothetical protein